MLRRRTPPSVVTLVTRQGCHLCALAEPVVVRAAAEAGARFETRDVDSDDNDRAAFSDKVPVVLLDGVEHAYWTIDERALRRALKG
jgi:glutaredoxin